MSIVRRASSPPRHRYPAVHCGILGDLFGYWFCEYLGTIKFTSEGLIPTDHFLIWQDGWFYVWGVCFALAVGMTASFIPAWRGSRTAPETPRPHR